MNDLLLQDWSWVVPYPFPPLDRPAVCLALTHSRVVPKQMTEWQLLRNVAWSPTPDGGTRMEADNVEWFPVDVIFNQVWISVPGAIYIAPVRLSQTQDGLARVEWADTGVIVFPP